MTGMIEKSGGEVESNNDFYSITLKFMEIPYQKSMKSVQV